MWHHFVTNFCLFLSLCRSLDRHIIIVEHTSFHVYNKRVWSTTENNYTVIPLIDIKISVTINVNLVWTWSSNETHARYMCCHDNRTLIKVDRGQPPKFNDHWLPTINDHAGQLCIHICRYKASHMDRFSTLTVCWYLGRLLLYNICTCCFHNLLSLIFGDTLYTSLWNWF